MAPLMTIATAVDLTEGLCRTHLAMVDADRLRLLREVRLELRLSPFLDEANLFVRVWQMVKLQAIERASWKAAA